MKGSIYKHVTQLIAVDCVIFGYEEDELKLLLFNRVLEPSSGEWSLVGGWVNENESVEDAAMRVLYKITGLKDVFQEQVEVFSKPDRDPGGRVISIVFYSLIRINEHDIKLTKKYGAKWFSIADLPYLIFDHNNMVDKALKKLRVKAGYELIGHQLLPEKFTLLQLRNLYSAVYLREFDPGNFRKKVLSLNILQRLSTKNKTESKKGAFHYAFKHKNGQNPELRIVKY